MGSLNPPLVFKTYQDVKNNLFYWTMILLVLSSLYIYCIILDATIKEILVDFANKIGNNGFISAISGLLIILLYAGISAFLIYGLQIHDKIYDKFFIKWRDEYDIEFILPKLVEPITHHLPKSFPELTRKFKGKFMKPFYDFVGDGKLGIEDNTRVRFYERVTWYWVTQLNEIFLILLIVTTLLHSIYSKDISLVTSKISLATLTLMALGLINRVLVRHFRNTVKEATIDEIEEIHSKNENVARLKDRYIELCNYYKL